MAHTEPRQRHRLTRLGLHFLFVGSFSMLGGSLRGLNLLLILAGGLMGALLVQWRWSRRSVESLSLRRRIPPEAFAGKPFRIRFRLTNHARFLPAWLLRVDDEIRPIDDDEGAIASTSVPTIPAGRSQTPAYDCLVSRRGRYRLGPSSVVSCFPLCLMTSRLVLDNRVEFDVYPRLFQLKRGWRSRLLTRTEGAVTSARRSGPAEGEFFGLREWQTGDHPRLIHWRTTARLGELAVRQFEQQRRFDVCLLVDGYGSQGMPGGERSAWPGVLGSAFGRHESEEDAALETAISLAATLLVHLVATPSNRTILAVAAEEPDAVIGGGSLEGKQKMLGLLARLQGTSEPCLAEGLQRAMQIARQPRDLIVVSTRSMRDAIAPRSDLNRMLHPWTRTGTLRWLNVRDPGVVRGFIKDVHPAEHRFGESSVFPAGAPPVDGVAANGELTEPPSVRKGGNHAG